MDKVSSVLPSSQVRTIVVSNALKRCMIAKFGQASYGEVTFAITRRCLYISSGNYGKSLFWVTISTALTLVNSKGWVVGLHGIKRMLGVT
jgi:hypothetical protein